MALVGLGWGLVFGIADALPALLEGDPFQHLGRRLLALLFMAAWNALAFGLVLAAAGLLAALVARLLRRPAGPRLAAALAFGLCAALTAAAFGAQRYPDAPPLVLGALALLAGAGVGWPAGAAAPGVGAGAARRLRRGVLAAASVALAVLLIAAVVHLWVRDWPLFNPRLTGQSATPERPNIVLVSIDALRADRLGVYGHRPSPSPRIDALAAQGLTFKNAISQGSSTVYAVAAFLTSLYPTELGMIAGQPWNLDTERVTIAEALQAGGYRTQAYVANGHLVAARGYAQGFDGYVPPEPDRPYDLDRLRGATTIAGLACRGLPAACRLFEGGYRLLFDAPLILENEGERINAGAERFIRLHRGEQFFMWLHYMEPHAAYRPGAPFGSVDAGARRAQSDEALRAWQPSNKTVPFFLAEGDRRALWTLYDGEISDVDELVGRLWDEIAAQGLADRTLLVITADHGDEFADHGDYGHGHSAYQELLHVPLIFVGPPVARPGRVVDTPVPMLDLLPTLVDVAGAPMAVELVHGQTLLPVLRDEPGAGPAPRAFFGENPARRTSYDDMAMFEGWFKLVYNVQLDRAELYDLERDPREQRDLAAAEPDRVAGMRADLRAWAAAALQTWASLPKAGTQAETVDAAMEEALKKIGY